MIDNAYGYRLVEPGRPLVRHELPPLDPGPAEVVVEVAGCGVCHTDVSFAVDGVPTRHPLPLVLGHEISGRVVLAGDGAGEWLGRAVIVPAVVPCGICSTCAAGRPTICKDQFMPGNHGDGGFATHVQVPANGLCPVPDELPEGITLEMLSVVADAVTTPLEAIRVQVAAAMGAAVAAVDIDQDRLELASNHGAALALDATRKNLKEIKTAVREFSGASGRQGIGLKIFETSGTPAGQETAYALLGPGAHLAVVGFTPKKVELRLSNLMAFDARAEGNWGSSPECYPQALEMILAGGVKLEPYVEFFPLDEAPSVLEAVAEHRLRRRAILLPPKETKS
jgi:6-hydroxycyclohex-1-ene-1-carbonyl-CoA dehydrogenase